MLDCLCSHFPAVSRAQWLDRFARGRVLDQDHRAIDATQPHRVGLTLHYFREVADEPVIPFREVLLYVDDHLVVADKPHFLPVTPAGRFVNETLLARLRHRLRNPDLVPLHRIDRDTAGLVLFSSCAATRGLYQALFRNSPDNSPDESLSSSLSNAGARLGIEKQYEAIAPALPDLALPLTRTSRIVAGEPFFRMREVDGAANARTSVAVLDRDVLAADGTHYWRYSLTPHTGKKHQLRVHMAALGAPIANDPFYPTLRDECADDARAPLKLLARRLCFDDPITDEPREFTSTFAL